MGKSMCLWTNSTTWALQWGRVDFTCKGTPGNFRRHFSVTPYSRTHRTTPNRMICPQISIVFCVGFKPCSRKLIRPSWSKTCDFYVIFLPSIQRYPCVANAPSTEVLPSGTLLGHMLFQNWVGKKTSVLWTYHLWNSICASYPSTVLNLCVWKMLQGGGCGSNDSVLSQIHAED